MLSLTVQKNGWKGVERRKPVGSLSKPQASYAAKIKKMTWPAGEGAAQPGCLEGALRALPGSLLSAMQSRDFLWLSASLAFLALVQGNSITGTIPDQWLNGFKNETELFMLPGNSLCGVVPPSMVNKGEQVFLG
jgi:hypothetical protein